MTLSPEGAEAARPGGWSGTGRLAGPGLPPAQAPALIGPETTPETKTGTGTPMHLNVVVCPHYHVAQAGLRRIIGLDRWRVKWRLRRHPRARVLARTARPPARRADRQGALRNSGGASSALKVENTTKGMPFCRSSRATSAHGSSPRATSSTARSGRFLSSQDTASIQELKGPARRAPALVRACSTRAPWTGFCSSTASTSRPLNASSPGTFPPLASAFSFFRIYRLRL